MKKLRPSDFGSLQNYLYATMINTPQPEVGMGATQLLWTDRKPFTIVAVHSPTEISVLEDEVLESTKSGVAIKFGAGKNNTPVKVKKKKDGTWREGPGMDGLCYLIGTRMGYYDWSF